MGTRRHLALLALLALPAVAEGMDSATARKLVTEKNLGLALLEQEKPQDARPHFETVAKALPDDPLGAADAGLAALRAKDVVTADKWFQEALRIAPKSAEVHALLGAAHDAGNRTDQAIAEYEQAVTLDPVDRESAYRLARLLTVRAKPADAARIREIYGKLVLAAPGNVVALVRRAEADLAAGDLAKAKAAWDEVGKLLAGVDAKSRGYLDEGLRLLAAGKGKEALPKLKAFENLQKPTAAWQQSLAELFTNVTGLPIVDFTAKTRGGFPPETAKLVELKFAVGGANGVTAKGGATRSLDGVLVASEAGVSEVRFEKGKASARVLPESAGATAPRLLDVDNDASIDVVALAGERPAIWKGSSAGFTPMKPAGLDAVPGAVAITPVDFDLDGDLDLLILSPKGSKLFRNKRDGGFEDRTAVSNLGGGASRAVVADTDSDGDLDVVEIAANGSVRILANRRQGSFADATAESKLSAKGTDVAAGDLDGDGWSDVVVLDAGGAVTLFRSARGAFGAPSAIGSIPAAEASKGSLELFDADNDGSLDVAVGGAIFRNRGTAFEKLALPAPLAGAVALDADDDGDLDLVGVDGKGALAVARNDGGNANGWLEVQLEALASGSGKVNRLGFGSTVEVKADRFRAIRWVDGPSVWFGLGARSSADVVRVMWPNGIPQNEISVKGKRRLKEVQQLKGSCPFLYAWNGSKIEFVTDLLGNAPLGLLYDGVHLAAADPSESMPIPGAKLKTKDGRAELRLTEELWETMYVDLARLEAVDHPEGTRLVTNERLGPPPFPENRLDVVADSHPVRAIDRDGRDVTDLLAAEDARFTGGFGESPYQGIADRMHFVELDLGPEAAAAARAGRAVTLDLTGWLFYADTSLNVSMSQDSRFRPQFPVLEVPDGAGGWRATDAVVGAPAGKTKTILVELAGILRPEDPRIRIRTNLVLHWDRATWSTERNAPHRRTGLPLLSAELRERGFSRRYRAVPDGPHLFDYDDVTRGPKWRDAPGRYTALGDVREPLLAVDDRYVVFKGGDEIALSFDASALPPVPDGWVRDWLITTDGWDKDHDLNTVTGDTVTPLPFHAQKSYPPAADERYPDDPAHREFALRTLTRVVTGDELRDAFRKDAP